MIQIQSCTFVVKFTQHYSVAALLDSFNGSFIDSRGARPDYGGEDSDESEGAVERLRKDVHGLGVTVRRLEGKIGAGPYYSNSFFEPSP
jgi:hypothetical protein